MLKTLNGELGYNEYDDFISSMSDDQIGDIATQLINEDDPRANVQYLLEHVKPEKEALIQILDRMIESRGFQSLGVFDRFDDEDLGILLEHAQDALNYLIYAE